MIRRTEKLYDHLYTSVGSVGDPCVYCGQPSDSVDHVPCLDQLDRYKRAGLSHGPLIKYPACHECNSILGVYPETDLDSRRKHIQAKLRNKYKHFLKIPDWSKEEFEELGEAMAKDVKASLEVRDRIRLRLSWNPYPELDD